MIKPEIIRAKQFKEKKVELQKDCMELWAFLVKLKADLVCEYPNCHRRNQLNAHHIFTRRKESTRYDPQNGMCLCPLHHSLGAESAHNDPEFKTIIINSGVRTQSFYDTLRIRAFTPVKLDLELEKLYLISEIKTCLKIKTRQMRTLQKYLKRTLSLFVE